MDNKKKDITISFHSWLLFVQYIQTVRMRKQVAKARLSEPVVVWSCARSLHTQCSRGICQKFL